MFGEQDMLEFQKEYATMLKKDTVSIKIRLWDSDTKRTFQTYAQECLAFPLV